MKKISFIVFLMIVGYLLVNYPILGVVDQSGRVKNLPLVYLYFYVVWVGLVITYYFLSRYFKN